MCWVICFFASDCEARAWHHEILPDSLNVEHGLSSKGMSLSTRWCIMIYTSNVARNGLNAHIQGLAKDELFWLRSWEWLWFANFARFVELIFLCFVSDVNVGAICVAVPSVWVWKNVSFVDTSLTASIQESSWCRAALRLLKIAHVYLVILVWKQRH